MSFEKYSKFGRSLEFNESLVKSLSRIGFFRKRVGAEKLIDSAHKTSTMVGLISIIKVPEQAFCSTVEISRTEKMGSDKVGMEAL
jgi:hypothetical protein